MNWFCVIASVLYELIITLALSEKNCSKFSFFSCPNLSLVTIGFCFLSAPDPLIHAYWRALETVFAATCKIIFFLLVQ